MSSRDTECTVKQQPKHQRPAVTPILAGIPRQSSLQRETLIPTRDPPVAKAREPQFGSNNNNLIQIDTAATILKCVNVVGCHNVRSIKEKSSRICDIIAEHHLDFFVAVETWHEPGDSVSLGRITPPGYKLIDKARPTNPAQKTNVRTNHGGIAVVYRSSWTMKEIDLRTVVTTFEYLCGSIACKQTEMVLLTIYRPGSKPATQKFLDELSIITGNFIDLPETGCHHRRY